MSSSVSNNVKSSILPHKGISKNLLTPCRRIGLSRNRKPTDKTFNSPLLTAKNIECVEFKQSFSLCHSNSDNVGNESLKKLNTTSQSSILSSLSNNGESKISNADIETPQLKKSKIKHSRDAFKKQSVKAVKGKHTNDMIGLTKTVVIEKTQSEECLNHLKNIIFLEEKTQFANCKEINSDHANYIEIDSLNLEKLNKEVNVHLTRINLSNSAKRKTESITSHRKIRRKLSMKKSCEFRGFDLSDADDDLGLLKYNSFSKDINCEGNTKDNVSLNNSLEKHEVYEHVQDSVLLNNSCVKEVSTSSHLSVIDDVLHLEKQVHEKEVHLSKLQQAGVYHNLHNVEDLYKVTNVWKSKCQDALYNLLEKLKEHARLDMPTLLRNLNVPSNLISYNCEEDLFV